MWTSGGSWWLVAGCLLSSCLGWAAVPTPPPGWACPTRPRPSLGSVKGELQVDGQDLVQAAGEVSSWGRRTWLYSPRWSCLPSLCLRRQCPWWRSAVAQAVRVPDRWWCWWWSQPRLLTPIHHPLWSRRSPKCRSMMWGLPGLVTLRVVQLVGGSAQLSPRWCFWASGASPSCTTPRGTWKTIAPGPLHHLRLASVLTCADVEHTMCLAFSECSCPDVLLMPGAPLLSSRLTPGGGMGPGTVWGIHSGWHQLKPPGPWALPSSLGCRLPRVL